MAETPFLVRMRDRGMRVTAQRRAVADVFDGTDVHLTAEDVHREASRSLPELSLATVYNTLNTMVTAGLLTETHHLPGATRYDPAPQPHHHLVCRRCHRLVDVDAAAVGPVALADEHRHRFAVESVEITFQGLCGDCLSRAASSVPSP